MWQGVVTWPRICLESLKNIVWAKLKGMSGLILKSVRVNSWTAIESMSPPTINGANPEHHAL